MSEHPHAYTAEEEAALGRLRAMLFVDAGAQMREYKEEVVCPPDLYDQCEDLMGRVPSFELKTGEDGMYVMGDDGHVLWDYDKPNIGNLLYVRTDESRPHFLFQYVKVIRA